MRSNSQGREPLEDFHRRCLEAVSAAHRLHPDGFDIDDLAERFVPTLPQRDRQRLKEWIERHDGADVLRSNIRLDGAGWSLHPILLHNVDDGLWIAANGGDMSIGLSRQDRLREAAEELGGIVTLPQLAQALGYGGEAGYTKLKRDLRASPDIEKAYLPWPGWRTSKALKHRDRIPVPGRLMLLDLRIATAESGGSDADVMAKFRSRVVEIGEALSELRDCLDLTVFDLLTTELINKLNADFCACHRQVAWPSGGTVAFSAWWASQLIDRSLEEAVITAWRALEDAEEPYIAQALSVAFWRALQVRTGYSGALLSRGGLVAV